MNLTSTTVNNKVTASQFQTMQSNGTSLPRCGAVPPLTAQPILPMTVGQVYTTNNTSIGNWTVGSASHNPLNPMIVINPDKTVMEVKGRMILNGVDLEERLKTIEKVLTIPERDVKLEAKHPKLKKLYDEYIAALGKYRTFEAIKGDEDVT